MRVVILYLKQHPSRGNSHVVKCQNQHAPKEISGIPVIRADGRPIDRLVRCDFLLVFYGDVTSGWNRCPFISRQSHWYPNSQQKITRTTPRSIQWAACATRQKIQACVQLPTYTDNVALPAFARRTPLLQQSIDISRPAHSSKPAAAGLLLWTHAETHIMTDTVSFHRPCCAYYAGSVDKLSLYDRLLRVASTAMITKTSVPPMKKKAMKKKQMRSTTVAARIQSLAVCWVFSFWWRCRALVSCFAWRRSRIWASRSSERLFCRAAAAAAAAADSTPGDDNAGGLLGR